MPILGAVPPNSSFSDIAIAPTSPLEPSVYSTFTMTIEVPWESAIDDHASSDDNTTITSIIWVGTNSTCWNLSQPAICGSSGATESTMLNTSVTSLDRTQVSIYQASDFSHPHEHVSNRLRHQSNSRNVRRGNYEQQGFKHHPISRENHNVDNSAGLRIHRRHNVDVDPRGALERSSMIIQS